MSRGRAIILLERLCLPTYVGYSIVTDSSYSRRSWLQISSRLPGYSELFLVTDFLLDTERLSDRAVERASDRATEWSSDREQAITHAPHGFLARWLVVQLNKSVLQPGGPSKKNKSNLLRCSPPAGPSKDWKVWLFICCRPQGLHKGRKTCCFAKFRRPQGPAKIENRDFSKFSSPGYNVLPGYITYYPR